MNRQQKIRFCHSRKSGDPYLELKNQIPAFVGMTNDESIGVDNALDKKSAGDYTIQ